MFYCSFFPPKVKQNLTVICSKRPFVFLTGNLHVKIKQKLIILANFQNFRKLKSHAPGPPFKITTLAIPEGHRYTLIIAKILRIQMK